jgi:thiamine pyrophosphokinase
VIPLESSQYYLSLLVDTRILMEIHSDLDSLKDDVREYFEKKGAEILEIPDQYATDFTKCIVHIRNHVSIMSLGSSCLYTIEY